MILKIKKILALGLGLLFATTSMSYGSWMDWCNSDGGYCCPSRRLWYVSAAGSVGFRNATEFVDPTTRLRTTSEYHHKTVFGGTLAVGRTINKFRVELEGSYRQNYLESYEVASGQRIYFNDSLKFGNLNFMANGYIDMPLSECVKFYVGGGIGASLVYGAEIKSDSEVSMMLHIAKPEYKYQDTVFAWQGMAGFIVPINDCFDIVFGYKFFATKKADFGKIESNTLRSTNLCFIHLAEAGIRFKF